ncbi:gamma-tubulin complex component 6 [Bufo gargarizans]|uniref:gamma-tubulin complex component 6 n=1 Tax=Bufo gargarizans TaxID=30331 RepID=UPI001CF2E332|nr:gamma-tubulin complex component 6 [Bufo gargarizans]XP_044136185.1 gamma-tubulin complex component 6 [Bufo gargarizans]
MNSITQLFGDLCESHLTGFPWKAGLGVRSQSKKRTKNHLKRLAYDTLFIHLYQEETRKLQSKTPKLPVKNKMIMLSFNLRIAGMSSEADRLEELMEYVEKFSGEQFTNLCAVLELLVDLAGTGPPQVLPPKRDLFQNNKYVDRNPQYQGYDYYDVSVFEADIGAFLAYQEFDISNTINSTLQIMEAAPGTGLPAIGDFSQNFYTSDKFEKETRVSLFGALVHTRTNDMDIKLDFPPVPDSADLSGLDIKVPQSIDQSEDEGFQSASNMTPDSQSEPSATPDVDLWEAILTYGPSKRRCWERIGFPPGKREDPYLTEAGREAFDKMYKIYEGNLQILTNTVMQSPAHVMLKESELVKDVLNVLIGVVSATFSFNQSSQTFLVKQGIYVSGTSPENIGNLLAQVADYGTYYTRLSNFSLQTLLDSSQNKGLVFQAFKSGLRKYLQYYRACVLSTPSTLSLLTISFLFRKLGRQLRYLAELCCIGTVGPGSTRTSHPSFPTGVKLLSYLYKEALENNSNENYPILLSLLKSSCEPYTRFIYDWVYTGVLRDTCKEFMIQVNEDFLGFRDKHYWTHGYVLISKDVEDCVPVFLKHLANEIYTCGKTINLLKLCCPKHYICWSDIPVPRISVTFSLEELKEIRKDCALYIARMDRIARQSSISKEEKMLQAEIAKQDLIIQARETSEKLLESFKDRLVTQRMSSDARKRELFLKLKEQYEKDQERRLAAKQEEADNEFSYARELRDREKRFKALEEELKLKARQELIQHYSQLSEEATQKEQRALWKLQRHKLETARLKFFLDEEKHLQELLEQNPVGSSRQQLHSETSDPGPASHFPLDDEIDMAPPLENESSGDLDHGEVRDGSLMTMQNTVTSPREKESDSINSPGDAVESINLATPALEFADFLPVPPTERQDTQLAEHQSPIDDALQDIGSDLPKSSESKDSTLCVSEYDFNTVLKPVAFTQVSQGHIQIGEYVSNEEARRPRWNIHGHMSDSNIKVGEYVPDTAVPKLQPSEHGHSSDSHINIGEYMSEVKPARPRWNVHGHISEGHIKVGEYASDIETANLKQNVHGHVSQANIKIGENISDVTLSRPRSSVHGHASDANIKIGENVSNVLSARPRWNIHGHASQSHIQLGELVSDTEQSKPHWNLFGHASQSSIKIGEWSPAVNTNEPAQPKSGLGHSSDSTVQNILYGERLASTITTETSETEDLSSEQTGSSETVNVLSPPSVKEKEESIKEENIPEDSKTASPEAPVDVQFEQSDTLQCTQGGSDDKTQNTEGPCDDQPAGEDRANDDAWQKQQVYLQTLADRYCLEKYQDTYDVMSKPPVLRLLSHFLPREFSFSVDPDVDSATDETAVQLIELLSLPVLMKYSVTAPIVSSVSLVNKAVVDYYFVELNMEKHFEAIRHFLLMEDGEFAQSLSDLLFEKLVSGQTLGELFTPLVLNSILSKALQYSLHGDSHLASNLSFALKYIPEVFASTAPDTFSCLELRYKVDWPLNIVITDTCINRYNKIFSFLLQLKHMVWTLRDVWFHLKQTALVNQASTSVQYRQLQLYRHEMQHFVKVIQSYIANQILHVTWSEFRNKLRTVSNLEEIRKTHTEYLNKALFRGLLTEKAAPLMHVIHSIFNLILKFRTQLISQSWTWDKEKQMTSHPNYGLMQQSYDTFKYYSDFLFEVVTKLVNRGYQPHLEDFLLRINFNSYYKEN